MGAEGWIRASREHPCPVCEGVDNCTMTADGRLAYCGRVSDGSTKQNAGGQFLHRLMPDQHFEKPAKPKRPRFIESGSVPPWKDMARAAFGYDQAAHWRQSLADELGVSMLSLQSLGIGCWPLQKPTGWVIPQKDGSGRIIGLARRWPGGRKGFVPGGKGTRKVGLVYPDNWRDIDGPILIPEGMSDTAALLDCGYCAIGRHSNTAGADLLAELLKATKRRIIVLGERDHKKHSELSPSVQQRHKPDCEACSLCFPGWFGANRVAQQLSDSLRRNVEAMFPPVGSKDVRDWLRGNA